MLNVPDSPFICQYDNRLSATRTTTTTTALEPTIRRRLRGKVQRRYAHKGGGARGRCGFSLDSMTRALELDGRKTELVCTRHRRQSDREVLYR